MEYTIVHRDPQAFQQSVPLAHIKAMCARAFGQATPVDSVSELDGGQFNNTYLIETTCSRAGCLERSGRKSLQT